MPFQLQDERGYHQGYIPRRKSIIVRIERRADYIISKMKKENKKVLEIGCGTGEVASFIANKTKNKVYAMDISKKFINYAKEKYEHKNLKFFIGDFFERQTINKIIKIGKVDYVVGNGILHHMYYKLDKVFFNMNLLLKKNGKIIFLEPNFWNPYCLIMFNIKFLRKIAKMEPGEMALKKWEIVELLEKNGFGNINVEYKDFLIPGIPDFLIKPSIFIGNIIEKIPAIKLLSQSIFISGKKIKEAKKY